MKTTALTILASSSWLAVQAQIITNDAPQTDPWVAQPLPDLSSWAVTARDEVSTSLQFTRFLTNTLTGEVKSELHGAVLVANGLNFLDADGVWRDSQDLITPMADGSAAALLGPMKVYYGASLGEGTSKKGSK